MEERIVVGVDGSINGGAALEFAVREAELRGATVDAVMVWHLPTGGGEVWSLPMPLDTGEMEESYRQRLDELISAVGSSSVTINPVLVQGSPARSLIEAASDAALLVVGRRGHGGFLGLLVGSVSHQVSAHAPCPVVVVPHADAEE